MHLHINTVLERDYATTDSKEFKPTNLGLSLISAYHEIESELCHSLLRAEMEENVKKIEKGELDYRIKLQ